VRIRFENIRYIKSSERVANFECLAGTVMNQNVVQVELLVTLDSTDARFHSVFKITFPCSIKKRDNKLFVFLLVQLWTVFFWFGTGYIGKIFHSRNRDYIFRKRILTFKQETLLHEHVVRMFHVPKSIKQNVKKLLRLP
jgi:hypothetical protein